MMKSTIRQGFMAQVVSLTLGTLAGIGLAFMRGSLEELPGMLIMVPAFLEMRGNIGGTLASRLGTALHMGIMEPRLKLSQDLIQNIVGTFILNIIMSLFIGILAHFMCLIFSFKSAGLLALTLIALIAGMISNIIITAVTIIATIKIYQRGLDPDIVMGTFITTLGDVVSIPCLFLSALIVMYLGV
ncbi:MAG: magnesium transporter [Candidatus Nezhaarchaeota archaeon]|nr:magnesium transporter [Candidatus Nezhaarchaeota archaeon]MCX8141422.1 magnesium transporter [Candidatus Nezhaarchaeota archaeon]MDW8049688.1 magnesium transporter [Nitrososphaerota archaeon]